MGRLGRQRAEAHFSETQMHGRYDQLFQEMLGGLPTPCPPVPAESPEAAPDRFRFDALERDRYRKCSRPPAADAYPGNPKFLPTSSAP